MAKKAKGARKAASTRTRKRAARRRSAPGPRPVNLTSIKNQLASHIERLGRLPDPTGQIKETINKLRDTRTFLLSQCGDSMVLPLKG